MINAETITLVMDIVLYVLLGLILLKCITGLFKGLWKTSCSLIISIILYILVVTLNTTFTQMYYGIDLSFISSQPFSVNGVEVTLSTAGDTIRNVVIALTNGSLDLSPTSRVFEVCDALAMSILAFVVFILHILVVTFIIAPLLSTLIYHLILKNILGKNITKKHKLKLAGFFVGGVKAVITTALLLTPFTALANQIGEVVNQEEYQFEGESAELKKYINAYTESSLAKVFTSIRIDDDSIDVALTNYVTSFAIDDENNMNFLDELAMMTDIACEGIQEGIITLDGFATDATAYLSKKFVTKVLIKLADSPLVTTLLPVALGIVANLESVKSSVDLTGIDWEKIDWSDELTALSDVYSTFYDTGLINSLLDPEELNNYEFNRETYPYFKKTFDNLNKVEILREVMPYVFSSFAKSMEEGELAGLLPTEVEYYQNNVNLGNELSCIYDAVMTLSDISSYVLDDSSVVEENRLRNIANSETRKYLTIGDLQDQEKLNTIIQFLLSKDAVNGGKEVEGEFVEYVSSTENEYQISTELIFNGYKDNDNEVNGLLDSSLIGDNITVLLKFALNSSEEIKEFKLDEVFNDIENDSEHYDWKKEVSSLLHICSIVVNNPNLPLDQFDIFNELQTQELRTMTPYIDNSDLIPLIVPNIITSLLGEEEIIYGLKANDFDFSCEKLGSEIDKLLSVLPKINNVKNNLSGGLNAFLDSESTFAEELEEVLLTVIDSKIINPSIDGTEKTLNNFEVLLKNIFGNDLQDVGFKALTEEFLIDIRTSPSGWKGEIQNICTALGGMKDLSTIRKMIDPATFNDNQPVNLVDIDTDEISSLIHDFSSSRIIENSMGSILNKYLKQQMLDMGLTIDFNAVSDWNHEADSLCEAIDIIKELDNHSFSLDNIDINSLRYYAEDAEGNIVTGADELGLLLESLYDLQCISEEIHEGENVTYKHAFDDVVYNLTENVLGDYIKDESKSQIEKDHNLEFESVVFNQGSNVSWVDNGEITEPGQCVINDIVSLLNHILGTEDKVNQVKDDTYFNDEGTLDLMKALDANGELENLLKLVNNIYIWRTVLSDMIPTVIDDAIGDMSFDGLDLSLLNSYTFKNDMTYSCDQDQTREEEIFIRNKEIEKINAVYADLDVFYDDTYDEVSGGIVLTIEKIQDQKIQDDLNHLLTDMASSKLFNEVRVDDEGIKSHTFFQDTVRYMLDLSSISQMMDYEIDSTRSDEQISEDANELALRAIMSVENASSEVNGWLSGEINRFITAITDASNVASLFSDGGNMNGLEGDKVEKVINSFALSEVLNYENSLGNILNSQIRGSFEGTGLNIDFSKVGQYNPHNGIIETDEEKTIRINEWKQEAKNFGQLVDNIKSINGDNSDTFDLNINLNDVDTDNLEKVLDSLSELKVVQNNYAIINIDGNDIPVDNYGNFIYTKVTNVSFADYINDDNFVQIINDHNIQHSNFTYDENEEISWVIDNEEGYLGENHNIVSLIKNLQEGGFVSGEGNVNFADVEVNDSTRNLIKSLNKNYIFRSLLKPIIQEKITSLGGSLSEIDPSKAYVSVFNNELNYQSNKAINDDRLGEENSRQEELDLLLDIFNEMNDMENTQDSGEGADKYKDLVGTKEETGTIEKLLVNSHESWLLNNNEPGYEEDFTVFEDTVKYIMDSTTLTSMVEYEYKTITISDTSVTSLINKVSVSESLNGPLQWMDIEQNDGTVIDGEITKLCDVLYGLVNAESKEIDPATGEKKHLTFTNPDQITNIDNECAKGLMNLLNVSYLCHGAVGNAVNQIYDNTSLADYALDKTNLIDAYSLDYKYVNDFAKQVEAWAKDITPLFILYEVVGSSDNVYDSLVGIDEYGNDVIREDAFETLLPNVMRLENIENCRSDVLYGLFKEVKVHTFLYEHNVSYTEAYVTENANTTQTSYTYKMYDFQRRETLNVLINKIQLKDNWEFEGQKLDNIASVLFNEGEVDNIKNLDSSRVSTVMKGTYSYDEDDVVNNGNYEAKYTRGYLDSELIASFIGSGTSSFASDTEEEKIEYENYFWRGKDSVNNVPTFDYKELNEFEVNALAAMIDVSNLMTDFTDNVISFTDEEFATWQTNYRNAMKTMGERVTSEEKTYYLGENQYNSIIAERIWKMFTLEETNRFNSTFSAVGVTPDWSLHDSTFLERYDEDWGQKFELIYNSIPRG